MKDYELIDRFLLITASVIREEKEKLISKEDLNRITYGQFKILYWISVMENPTITTLSIQMAMTKPTMTVHIQNLEKLALVCREKSTADKRVSFIRLTDKGNRVQEAEQNAFMRLARLIDMTLTGAEKKSFYRSIEKLLT